MNLIEKINEAAAFIKNLSPEPVRTGIILGSGLGGFTREISIEKEIPYRDIPHFPVSTVKGHEGKLVIGTIGNKRVIAQSGRFHCYEGYSAQEIVFPVRVMKYLGAANLLISNAAGAMNSSYRIGDLVMIRDHVSFFVPNPLIGPNHEELGPRFPDMSEPYSKALMEKARKIAAEQKIEIKEGVYCAVTGPTFETRAEYRLLLACGCDAVGMSTVPEVIVARHMGVECFAVSVITDLGVEGHVEKVSHEEVLKAANIASVKLTRLITELVKEL
jgi:purine-nucleoside phosphorylase